MDTDYLVERRLKKLNMHYHDLVANSNFAIVYILEKYKNFFADFTDHSIAHSLNVLDFVNKLIGNENIEKLNADELYILMMGAYFHDTGMGISQNDFELAKGKVIPLDYLNKNPLEEVKDTIRKFHHELSGFFVEKYHDLFEIPTQKHVFAIAAVSRGHRKTDLYDDAQFPSNLLLDNGNAVCVPYLASLIRLADEMDIAEDRIFAFEFPESESDSIFRNIHHCIKKLEVTDEALIYYVKCDDSLYDAVKETIDKLEKTFNDCKEVIENRTSFKIKQNKVIMIRMN